MRQRPSAGCAHLHVLDAGQRKKRIALSKECALLRNDLHAALKDDLAVRTREQRTRDPRRRLFVDDDLPRARIKRLLQNLGGVLWVESKR